jgi:DNA primase
MNFSDRVIVPIYDLDGQLVTFQGRDLSGKSERKYLFPPGLPGTARFLLNGQNAVRASRVVMGEGAFDAMGIRMATKHRPEYSDLVAIGSFGMNLTSGGENDQGSMFLRLKKTGLKEVFIMWDGERRAFEKAVKAALVVSKLGIKSFVCTLPDGLDPGEAPGEDIRSSIAQARLVTPSSALKMRLSNPYAR